MAENTTVTVDDEMYDENGFHTETRIHRDTGTRWDSEGFNDCGFDEDGYDREGYNAQGYDCDGWTREDIHRHTGTEFDLNGRTRSGGLYDCDGYNAGGWDCFGYDRDGYDSDGYNEDGEDRDGNSRCDNGDCDDADCERCNGSSDDLFSSDTCVIEETGWIRSRYRPTAPTIAFEFECYASEAASRSADEAAEYLLARWNPAYQSTVNNTRTGEGAICKEDGSLRDGQGLEFVTVPMLLDEHRRVLRAAFNSRFGDHRVNAWSISKCGMHVHLARSSLSNLTLGKMLCFMHRQENIGFHVAIAGRSSSYAAFNTYNARVSLGLPKNARTDKYSALNVKDYTVEFRIFRPSCQFNTLLKNLCYCLAVRDFCRQSSLATQALSWDRFLLWLGTTNARRTYHELDAWLRRQDCQYGTYYQLHAKPAPKPKPETAAVA